MKHTVNLTQISVFFNKDGTADARFSRKDSACTARITWHKMTWKQYVRFAMQFSKKFGNPVYKTMAYTKRTVATWEIK